MQYYLNNKRITKQQALNYYIKMLGNNIAKQIFEKDIAMLKNTLEKNDYSYFWQLKIVRG